MHLLYINLGSTVVHHSQAAFSIYSFLAYSRQLRSITVMTDAPEWYKGLNAQVKIREVDAATQKEWIGPYRFFFRAKIKAIESLCSLYPGEPVVYLDSDTFAYAGTERINDVLQKGTGVMHLNEGLLSRGKSKSERRLWSYAKYKQYGGITITEKDGMWNAGVIGTPNTRGGEECRLALQICDDICAAGVKTHMNEQFAVSVALQKIYGLEEAKNTVAHYWSNKEEWNQLIGEFFAEAFLKTYSSEDIMTAIKEAPFKKVPVHKKVKNTAARLHRLVNRLFKARDLRYIRK